jgi:hypothetical protein
MIRLTLIGGQSEATLVASALYFRITDGMVSTGPGLEPETALARHVAGRWKHGDVLWSGMRFEGKIRLVFGLTRDPSGVSDVLDGVSIAGAVLSANGIPFAVYDQELEMWRGAGVNRWWHAFRIESADFRPSAVKPIGPEEDVRPPGDPLQDPNESAPPFN